MSVALSNGASVVAFIGLSAETLRGFLFLYDFVERVKDAPGDLRYLYVQLTFFQVSFATFRESVVEAARLGSLAPLSEQTRLALDDAETTVKEFKGMMEEYGEGRATPLRKRIKIARRSAQLAKMSQRLGNLSSQISMTHSGIALLNQRSSQLSIDSTPELDGKLAVLANTVSSRTATILSERCDAMSQVMEEATSSILDLIVDLSQKYSTIPASVANNTTSRGPSSPPDVRDNTGYMENTHLSAAIREAVSEVLPQMLRNAEHDDIDSSLSQKVKRKLLNDGLMSADLNSAATGIHYFPAYPTTGGSIQRLYLLPKTAAVDAGHFLLGYFKIQGSTLRDLKVPSWCLPSRVSIKTIFSGVSKDHIASKEPMLTSVSSTDLMNTQSGGSPMYLFVVLPGKHASRVVEIDLSNMTSDIELFRALRNTHSTRIRRFLSPNRVIGVQFIGFEVFGKGWAHIKSIDTDMDSYPSPDNKDYHCSPKPPKNIPPVGRRLMAHYFIHPEHAEHQSIVLDFLPKSSVSLRELLRDQNPGMPQYGLSIAEAFDLRKLTILFFFATSTTSVMVGVLWSICGWSIQESFSAGNFFLAMMILSFTSLQAMTELIH